jgi:hypothetical protein
MVVRRFLRLRLRRLFVCPIDLCEDLPVVLFPEPGVGGRYLGDQEHEHGGDPEDTGGEDEDEAVRERPGGKRGEERRGEGGGGGGGGGGEGGRTNDVIKGEHAYMPRSVRDWCANECVCMDTTF